MKKWRLVCVLYRLEGDEVVPEVKHFNVDTNSPDEVIVPADTAFFCFVEADKISEEDLLNELVFVKFGTLCKAPEFLKKYKLYAVGKKITIAYNEKFRSATIIEEGMTVVDI